MWLFMYVCYLMGALTYVLFLFSALQDIFQFVLFGVPRLTFAFLTAIFYLFTQTLTVFFFVGHQQQHPRIPGVATGDAGPHPACRPRPLHPGGGVRPHLSEHPAVPGPGGAGRRRGSPRCAPLPARRHGGGSRSCTSTTCCGGSISRSGTSPGWWWR